jgi:hypothetical protein
MMGVDLKIASRFYRDVDQTMSRDLIHHMIEEWESRLERAFTAAVEVDGYRDLRFIGITRNSRCTADH